MDSFDIAKTLLPKLKEAVARLNIPGVVLPPAVIKYCCVSSHDAPDRYWQAFMDNYLNTSVSSPPPDAWAHWPTYVGSVWGIGGDTLYVSTRADALAAIKPAQYSIHYRPEDIAWVQSKTLQVLQAAGIPAAPFVSGGVPHGWPDTTPAWTDEVIVNIEQVSSKFTTRPEIPEYAVKYGISADAFMPCPYCGCRHLLLNPEYGGELVCLGCHAQAPYRETAEQLLAFWNNRHPAATDPNLCPFCGGSEASVEYRTIYYPKIMQIAETVAICKTCGAIAPHPIRFCTGSVISASEMRRMRDGVVRVPAPPLPAVMSPPEHQAQPTKSVVQLELFT